MGFNHGGEYSIIDTVPEPQPEQPKKKSSFQNCRSGFVGRVTPDGHPHPQIVDCNHAWPVEDAIIGSGRGTLCFGELSMILINRVKLQIGNYFTYN